MKKINPFVFLVFFILFFSCTKNSQTSSLLVGKYNESGEKGLAVFEFDQSNGTFKMVSESDAGPNPSYFCISKKNGLIYAANEVMNYQFQMAARVSFPYLRGRIFYSLQITQADQLQLSNLMQRAFPKGLPIQ